MAYTIWENGIEREMTAEEIVQMEADARRDAEEEAHREPTEAEKLRADIDFLLAMGGFVG